MASNSKKMSPRMGALIFMAFGLIMIAGTVFTSRETRAFLAEATMTEATVSGTRRTPDAIGSEPHHIVDFEFTAEGKAFTGNDTWGGTVTEWRELAPGDRIEVAYVLDDDVLNADSRLVTGDRLGFPWGFLAIGVLIFSGGVFMAYQARRKAAKG